MSVEFDCPECGHVSHHWSIVTGCVRVFWHFFTEHDEMMERSGSPFNDEEGPQFSEEEV